MSKKNKLTFWVGETDMDYRCYCGSEEFQASSVKEAEKYVSKLNKNDNGGYNYTLGTHVKTSDGLLMTINEYRQEFEKPNKKKKRKEVKKKKGIRRAEDLGFSYW